MPSVYEEALITLQVYMYIFTSSVCMCVCLSDMAQRFARQS